MRRARPERLYHLHPETVGCAPCAPRLCRGRPFPKTLLPSAQSRRLSAARRSRDVPLRQKSGRQKQAASQTKFRWQAFFRLPTISLLGGFSRGGKEAEVCDEYPDGKKFEEVWIPVKKKASFAVNVTGRRLFSVTSGLEQVSALMKAHPVRSAYRMGCAFSFTAAGSLARVYCSGGFQPLMRPAVSNSALP